MSLNLRYKRIIALSLIFVLMIGIVSTVYFVQRQPVPAVATDVDVLSSGDSGTSSDYIKYVEFNPTYTALSKALQADIDAHNKGISRNWITLLAYLAAKYGGDFSKFKSSDFNNLIEELDSGQTMDELTANMQYYNYYLKAYTAVLGGLVGGYQEQRDDGSGNLVWVEKYGLIGFSPIAKGFPFTDYNDFGVQRTYGYTRRHLGHDLFAQTGTPVIAVEGGTVEELGWNQYGGWRIGIRSDDGLRYYYYAHLRQNRPYAEGMEIGKQVQAGDVIGYVGRTGYSATENVNGLDTSHLHLGLELIFDESQKEGSNQIWVNLYALTMLLQTHQGDTVRDPDTKEYTRKYQIKVESTE